MEVIILVASNIFTIWYKMASSLLAEAGDASNRISDEIKEQLISRLGVAQDELNDILYEGAESLGGVDEAIRYLSNSENVVAGTGVQLKILKEACKRGGAGSLLHGYNNAVKYLENIHKIIRIPNVSQVKTFFLFMLILKKE